MQRLASMRFLPIVERELRVAARQPKTWWQRVLTMVVALAILAFGYVAVGQWTSLSDLGEELFGVLSGFGLIYALLAGPLATVDCLGHERREGTLGLLFLTDLRSYDVVFGKTAAASLSTVLALLGALPVVALPILMGGVSLMQLTFVMLALMNIMFLSLATGVCASALFASARTSLAVTLGFLLALSLGLVFVGGEILGIGLGMSRRAAAYFYMFCPIYTMKCCLDGSLRQQMWDYWLNMGAMHALAWACLWRACRRTAESWRGLPVSVRVRRWRERWERWRRGSAASRLAWRECALARSPVGWLEGRDRLQERLFWAIILGSAIFCALRHLRSPDSWPDEDWLILWPVFPQYALCLWIAIQAPRRLADDKQSGALELLLCTPVTPGEIVRGSMGVLRRRFGRALVALLALDAFLILAYFNIHGGWRKFWHDDLFSLATCAAVVFPVQTCSLARIGLYEGLVRSNSLRATFMTIWKAGLLPWVLFIGFMVTWETAQNHYRAFPRITQGRVLAVWAGAHLLACGVFLAQASWRLQRDFRVLAAQLAGPVWWKRWLRVPWLSSQATAAPLTAHPVGE
jgi:ABC-type transport system involved in cytochrome c biogenesis permease component